MTSQPKMSKNEFDAWVELAKRDPSRFMEFTFRDKTGEYLRQSAIHREFQSAVFDHQHLMVEWPREHGKTTQAVGRVIWELGTNPDANITIVGANDDKAKKRLSEVTTHIQRNKRVQAVFPKLAVDSSSKTKLLLKRGRIARESSVEAYGVLSSGTGDRSDLILFDDICDRRNSLTIPALRRAVKDAYYEDWMNLLGPKGRSIYLFTPWHKDDLSHELIAAGNVPYIQHRVKAEWTSIGDLRRLDPVWPEVWNETELRKRLDHIKRRAFMRGFCGSAVDDTDRVVWPEWIKFGWPKFRLADAIRIQIWDGAAPRKVSSTDPDYMAYVDMYLSSLHSQIFVADAWRARGLSPSQQVEAVISRTMIGPPVKWLVIEETGQSALAALVAESGHHFNGATLIPINTEGKAKERRTEEYAAPLLEGGQMIFSPSLDPVENPGCPPVVAELTEMPFGDHDDLADCVTYGARLCKRLASFGRIEDEQVEPKLTTSIGIH